MVVIDLTLAVVCFMGQCHPALTGPATPRGSFELKHQATEFPGYGGDLLVFKEDATHVWAIHRVWNGQPKERRLDRLRSGDAALRRGITHGCVNVMPEVYAQLVDCCRRQRVLIR